MPQLFISGCSLADSERIPLLSYWVNSTLWEQDTTVISEITKSSSYYNSSSLDTTCECSGADTSSKTISTSAECLSPETTRAFGGITSSETFREFDS